MGWKFGVGSLPDMLRIGKVRLSSMGFFRVSLDKRWQRPLKHSRTCSFHIIPYAPFTTIPNETLYNLSC